MGVCKICGNPAGLFRSEHVECRTRIEAEAAEASDRALAITSSSKQRIIACLDDRTVPDFVHVAGDHPLILQKDEKIIWAFPSEYLKAHTVRSYEGGSRGVSIRVARGISVRAGSYKGRSVSHLEMASQGIGDLVVASKNLYFAARTSSVRLAYKKIVSVDALSDCIEIIREAATPKPEIFKVDDPQFAVDMITRLAAI